MNQTGFDTTQMERELTEVFFQYRQLSSRALPVILDKQIQQLAVGAKGVKGLFQEARDTRPATVKEIKSLPKRLGYRIKRDKGVTVVKEIASRIAQAGYFQASGWLYPGVPTPRGGGAKIKTLRGSIQFTAKNGQIARITLSNSSPGAAEFGAKTGYIERAIRNRIADMKVYCQRAMDKIAADFSKPKPKFRAVESYLSDFSAGD